MKTGTVKWFDDLRGFGFITSDDGTDIFVHRNQVEFLQGRTLFKGHRVAFKIEDERGGRPRAAGVRVIGHVDELENLIARLDDQQRAQLLEMARRLAAGHRAREAASGASRAEEGGGAATKTGA